MDRITLIYLDNGALGTPDGVVQSRTPFTADLDWFCRQTPYIRARLGHVLGGVIHPPVTHVPLDPTTQWDEILAVWTKDIPVDIQDTPFYIQSTQKSKGRK